MPRQIGVVIIRLKILEKDKKGRVRVKKIKFSAIPTINRLINEDLFIRIWLLYTMVAEKDTIRGIHIDPDVHFPTCEPLSRRSPCPDVRSQHVNLSPDVRFPTHETLFRRSSRPTCVFPMFVSRFILFHIGLVRGMVQVLDVRLSPEAYSRLQMSIQ